MIVGGLIADVIAVIGLDRRGDGRRRSGELPSQDGLRRQPSTGRRASSKTRAAVRLHAEHRARFDEIVQRYPPDRRDSAVLPALYLAQKQQGYITANAIRHVARLLGITRADVEDVVSFYTMFYRKAESAGSCCRCAARCRAR
jgi:hypothetical protein